MMDNEYSPVAHVLALWHDRAPLETVAALYRHAVKMHQEGDALEQVGNWVAAAAMIEEAQKPVEEARLLIASIEASRRALAEAEAVPENRKAVA